MTKEIREYLDMMYSLSKCLLYTRDQYGEYLNWRFLMSPYKVYFKSALFKWGARFAEEDIDEIESKGITREDLRNICDKSKEILDKTFLEVPDQSSSLFKLAQIFYQDKTNEILQLVDELAEIYDSNHSKLKSTNNLVNRDLEGRGLERDFIHIENPYKLIPPSVEKIRSFIDEIESKKENISMKPFVFTEKFQILSTFSDDIKDKGLSPEEVKTLLNAWSLLIVKAFTLNQVTVKLTQKELIDIRNQNNTKFSTETKDSEIQLFSEYEYLSSYFKKIYQFSADLDEEKLNEIYQNHKDDEVNKILKPFFEDLIPEYKSIITPEGFAKLTNQVTGKYGVFVENPIFHLFSSGTESKVLPIYFDYIPFKLIDPPSNMYYQALKLLLNNIAYGYACPCFEKLPFPKDFEEIDELDTVNKQKYYVVGFIIDFYNRKNEEKLRYHDGCLLLSIIPWEIDLDCEDAKKIENDLRNICNDSNKNYDYDYARARWFARYLITSVVPATQPLNPESLKNKMSQLSQAADNRAPVDSGNPLNGCCSIQ